MSRIAIATAIALGTSASAALAAGTTPLFSADLTTKHCSYLERQLPKERAKHTSDSAFQAAEENALSLCRQNKDHDALSSLEMRRHLIASSAKS